MFLKFYCWLTLNLYRYGYKSMEIIIMMVKKLTNIIEYIINGN